MLWDSSEPPRCVWGDLAAHIGAERADCVEMEMWPSGNRWHSSHSVCAVPTGRAAGFRGSREGVGKERGFFWQDRAANSTKGPHSS